MSFIQRELARISEGMERSHNEPEKRREFYAAQQALSWALDPDAFRAPYETVTGTQEDSEGCSEHLRPLPS